MLLQLLSILVLALGLSSARPTAQVQQRIFPLAGSSPRSQDRRRPLVIWHGLGDTANSDGISGLIADIKSMFPGIYVHSVQMPAAGSVDDERRAGFYGNASSQVDAVSATIQGIPELQDGFDAIGFSQGGLFMRDYVQRYNDPPVRNLVTFGSPHMGIARLIPCRSSFDLLCIIAKKTAEKGVYTEWAQNNLIQASYFRDHDRLEEFYKINKYLTRLNGELEYEPIAAKNIAGLDNLILVNFEQDQTIYPKESSTFGSLTPSKINSTNPVIPLTSNRFLWEQDHIGLRILAESGGLRYGTFNESCPGTHMDLEWGDEAGCGQRVVRRWIGWRV